MELTAQGENTSSSEALRPRLSIWHLMLWMAVAGVIASRVTVTPNLNVLIAVVMKAAAITVAAIVFFRCVRYSGWWQTEPGHWFAFLPVWGYVDQYLATPWGIWFFPQHEGMVYAGYFVGVAGLMGLGAIVGRWGWLWCSAVMLVALDSGVAAAWRIFNELSGWYDVTGITRGYVQPGVGIVAVLVLFSALGNDFYRRQNRGWMHWVGVAWILFYWQGVVRSYVVPYLTTWFSGN